MASVRKKKKHKSDPKASEQMRNWLTKHTSQKSTPPVTFAMFSKVVENLPDIAFQIQCNELGAANKTLDECALWFYNAFYSDPSVRTKYDFKLRSCPLRIKEKLLQVSPKAASTSTAQQHDNNERVPTEDGCVVKVNRSGSFLFPVSFDTFERYMDRKKVLDLIIRKETKDKIQRNVMLSDDAICRKLLRKYYNAFYIFPSRRHLEKFNFSEAPPALREQLVKRGIPLDELAVKTLEEKSAHPRKSRSSAQPENQLNSRSSIVSFSVFERFINNIYDIVWRLKLNEPEFAYKGFEDCAYEYYLAFYLTPEIRDKYPYELKPCTTAMKDRILGLPSQEDAAALWQIKNQNKQLAESQQVEQQNADVDDSQPNETAEEPAVESESQQLPIDVEMESQSSTDEHFQVTPPVTFDFFKRYITNLDQIVQQMLCCEQYKGRTEDECAMEYFTQFYLNPHKRERFGYVIKPCPAKVREKLLSRPKKEMILPCNVNDSRDEANSEQTIFTIGGQTYKFSVSFETFLQYINYEELKTQLAVAYEKNKGKSGVTLSDNHLMRRFYLLFYTDERVRKEFNYNFNAAPAKLRDVLLKLATQIAIRSPEKVAENATTTETTEPCVVEEHPSLAKESETPAQEALSTQSKESDAESEQINSFDWELGVGEDLGKAGRFMFPVSFETFRRCINYDDLIRPLLLRVVQDEAQFAELIANPLHPQCQKIFKRYYRSFYVRPNTRSLYEYRFGNVRPELLKKLLDFAVPLDGNAKKTIDDAANKLALANKKAALAKNNELIKTLPVTFTLFKRCIRNLDEIVKQMMSCAEYNGKSADDCALAYFVAFYTEPQIRERFKYDIKPCPAKLRNKLLKLPVPVGEDEQQQLKEHQPEGLNAKVSEPEVDLNEPLIEVCSSTPELPNINFSSQQNNNSALVQSEKIIITLQGTAYEFPVSFQTFKRFINYDTVRVELANSVSKNKQKVEKNLSVQRRDLIFLRRFYHSFYIDARARKLCNFNFDAAPAEMQKKLLEFAIPCKEIISIQSPLPTQCENNVQLNDAIPGDSVAVQQVEHEDVEMLQSQCNGEIRYPISYSIFSKILNLDEVVQQMKQEALYAKMTINECRLAFFDAFYRTPEIRAKYNCTLKPCPALLRAKLLQIPATAATDHDYSKPPIEHSESPESVAALYAARKAELAGMPKTNVSKYTPDNLSSYIALRTQCPTKRALLEQHFIGAKKQHLETTEEAPNSETAKMGEVKEGSLEEATTLDQSSVSVATTHCSNEVVNSQATTSSTNSAVNVVEIVSIRDLSRPINVSTPVKRATRTELENSEAATVIAAATSNVPATTTRRSPSSKMLTNLEGSESNASKASTSNMQSSGNALKAASASMSIAKNRALESTAVNKSMQNTLRNKTTNDALNLPTTRTRNRMGIIPSTNVKPILDFFEESSQEHNMKYLLCTSHGLKKTIWRILSQLSYAEFKTYTSIHADESEHLDESFLKKCYNHVLVKGNWPINLYVKLQMLPQLLHSKGVRLDALDLGQLSPKMLHWRELMRFSNFEEIVERFFNACTGLNIDDMEQLFSEVEHFYTMCWSSDLWIYQVPQVTQEMTQSIIWPDNSTINEAIPPATKPLCLIEDKLTVDCPELSLLTSSSSGTAATDLNANIALNDLDCPPTQLNLSLYPPCFVDIGNVCPASQAMEVQNDPLNQSWMPAAVDSVHVKQEPVKFLNMLRFSLESNSQSGNFICERITNEEQIINLDSEEQLPADLACFAMNNSSENEVIPSSGNSNLTTTSKDSFQELLAEVQRLADELPSSELLTITPPDHQVPAELMPTNQLNVDQVEPVPPIELMQPVEPTSVTTRPRKKQRLMADNVPQLRHEFRPLPLAAMVRIEPQGLISHLNKQQQEPNASSSQVQPSGSQPKSQNGMSVSQALATDNTLMESSQLQHLLDAPFVSQRKKRP